MVEWRFRMKLGIGRRGCSFARNTRFHGVRDYQIRFALDQRVEDRGVVAPLDDRCFL